MALVRYNFNKKRPGSAGRKIEPPLQVLHGSWDSVSVLKGGYISLLSSFIRGDDNENRRSDETVISQVIVAGTLYPTAAQLPYAYVARCYFWLVLDKAPTGQCPKTSDIFDVEFSNCPVSWFIRPDMTRRFSIRRNFVVRWDHDGAPFDKIQVRTPADNRPDFKEVFKQLNVRTTWKDTQDGSIASVKTGALYLVAATSSGCIADINMKTRVYFKSVM
jgi:hypothetical protein